MQPKINNKEINKCLKKQLQINKNECSNRKMAKKKCTKEEIKKGNKHILKYSPSLVIKEMPSKTPMRFSSLTTYIKHCTGDSTQSN